MIMYEKFSHESPPHIKHFILVKLLPVIFHLRYKSKLHRLRCKYTFKRVIYHCLPQTEESFVAKINRQA